MADRIFSLSYSRFRRIIKTFLSYYKMTRQKVQNQVMYNPDLSNKIHSYLTISPVIYSYFRDEPKLNEFITESENLIDKIQKELKRLNKSPNIITTICCFEEHIFSFGSDSTILFTITTNTKSISIPIKVLLDFFEKIKLVIIKRDSNANIISRRLRDTVPKKILKKVKIILNSGSETRIL